LIYNDFRKKLFFVFAKKQIFNKLNEGSKMTIDVLSDYLTVAAMTLMFALGFLAGNRR